jgi:hypothetical protein
MPAANAPVLQRWFVNNDRDVGRIDAEVAKPTYERFVERCFRDSRSTGNAVTSVSV